MWDGSLGVSALPPGSRAATKEVTPSEASRTSTNVPGAMSAVPPPPGGPPPSGGAPRPRDSWALLARSRPTWALSRDWSTRWYRKERR